MPQGKYPVTPYVQERKSYGENLLTREMHPTDGNMMGFEQSYGSSQPDMQQLQALPIDQTVKRFREMYGDEQAMMVLQELVKIQEESGGGLSGRAPTTLSEIESYGLAQYHPTDSNMMGHEARFGYPPTSTQTPFGSPQPQAPLNAFAVQGRFR